jgi:hypothetical protein
MEKGGGGRFIHSKSDECPEEEEEQGKCNIAKAVAAK